MDVVRKAKTFVRVLCEDGMAGVVRRIHMSERLRWYRRRGQKLNCRFGWRSKRPILIIESDDWGAEHIPSADVIKQMDGTGFFPKHEQRSLLDGLETAEDVDKLCDLLNSHKNSDGNPAVLTANFIMANADFSAIKESDYSTFKLRTIDTGWNHEPDSDALWQSYREGIKSGVLVPQLHGIMHLCPEEWLKKLRQGDAVTLKAFDFQVIGEDRTATGIGRLNLGPIYHSDAQTIRELVTAGASAFNRIFGYKSVTTIAPCYGWRSPETEEALLSNNVCVMQGREYQHLPNGGMKVHYMGERGTEGMFYMIRNCMLEPAGMEATAEQCVGQIAKSFELGLPAIVCSHRNNYTSRVSPQARDKGLAALDTVLQQVTKKFPEVEFLSSEQLALKIAKHKRRSKPGFPI